MNNLRQQATQGIFWSAIERFSVQGVQFLIGIIMARLLTPHDYGLIGMLAIFMSLSQVFIDGGFSIALIQKKDRTNEDFTTVFYINLAISVFLYLLIFLSAPYIASFFKQPVLIDVARVYCFNLVINSLAAVNKTKLTIDVDFKTQSKISLIAAIVSGAIGVYAAYQDFGVWALVIQAIVSGILNVALSFVYVKWLPSFQFSVQSFRKLFKFGSKVLGATIINDVYTNLYSLAIGKKYSAVDLGYYTRAMQFTSLVSDNLSGILYRVSLPILSTIQDDDERLVRVYRKYMQTACFLMFPLILLLCGISKPLIILLLTEKWADTIPLMQILCFNYLWSPVTKVNLNLLYVKGRSDLILKLEIIKKTIALTILFSSLLFNLQVVCIGLALYSFIAVYLNSYYTGKLLNYGFFKQMRDLAPSLAFSVIIMIESLTISEIVNNNILSIALSLIVTMSTYLLLSYTFKISSLREIFVTLDIKKYIKRR